MSPAAAINSASVMPGRAMPGTTGTPNRETVSFAVILSPMMAIAAADGPMNTTPASARAEANSAFSERNP